MTMSWQKVVLVTLGRVRNTGCIGRGRTALILLECGHTQLRKASASQIRRARCLPCTILFHRTQPERR